MRGASDAHRHVRLKLGAKDDLEGFGVLARCDLEVRHQLGWWTTRVDELERDLAASAADPLIVRELALFRGRISGAQAMVRHYQAERDALSALLVATNERYGSVLDAQ